MDKTIISILAGLSGMFGWGTSDFLANLSSDKMGSVKTFFWSQVVGLVCAIIVCLFLNPGFEFSLQLFFAALVCGMAYASGYILFYKALEIGNVSVASSVINLQVPIVIAIAFFISGQSLTTLQIPAIILMLIGITLVSINIDDLKSKGINLLKGVKESIFAALSFGLFYWPVSEYMAERMHWLSAILMIKVIALGIVLLITIFQKKSLKLPVLPKKVYLLIAGIGILESFGTLGVIWGQTNGDNIIISPIASALGVVTISLAIIFLKEKVTKFQAVGIFMTLSGIVLSAF